MSRERTIDGQGLGPEERTPSGSRPATALRAAALGVLYTAVVLALLLLGRVGKGFIYQGF